MFLRWGFAFAAGFFGMSACAAQPAPTFLPQSPARPSSGIARAVAQIDIEPLAIVFERAKTPPQLVRVRQAGFRGQYKMADHCMNASVVLVKYTANHTSVWRVSHAGGREHCAVGFTGTGGPKGTGSLRITIRR